MVGGAYPIAETFQRFNFRYFLWISYYLLKVHVDPQNNVYNGHDCVRLNWDDFADWPSSKNHINVPLLMQSPVFSVNFAALI